MKLALLLVLGLCGGRAVWAQEPNETQLALETIQSVRSDLHFIWDTGLHQADQGRILILDKAAHGVVKSIEAYGLGSMVTLNQYSQLIVKFRFSSQFFEFIRTQRTESAIRHVLDTVEVIRKKIGIDDEPYTKILKINLLQMVEAMEALGKVDNVDPATKKHLADLRPALGQAIAIADLGDRPKAFAAAKGVYYQVKALYSELETITFSTGYNLAIEIVGLNQFIKEYAQIPD